MGKAARAINVALTMSVIKDTSDKIKEIREQAMSLAPPDLKKEIAQASTATDARFVKLIDLSVELQDMCDKMLAEVSGELVKTLTCIDKLSDVELKNIALMRYIQGLKLDDIADKMHVDKRTVSRKLKKIEDFLKDVS